MEANEWMDNVKIFTTICTSGGIDLCIDPFVEEHHY